MPTTIRDADLVGGPGRKQRLYLGGTGLRGHVDVPVGAARARRRALERYTRVRLRPRDAGRPEPRDGHVARLAVVRASPDPAIIGKVYPLSEDKRS